MQETGDSIERLQNLTAAALQASSEGDLIRAEKLFTEAIEIDASIPELLYGRAHSRINRGAFELGASDLALCLTQKPSFNPARVLELQLKSISSEKKRDLSVSVQTGKRRSLKELEGTTDCNKMLCSPSKAVDSSSPAYLLKNFFLVGKHGLLISPTGEVLEEQTQGTFFEEHHLHLTSAAIAFLPQLLERADFLPGRYVPLIAPFATNFYHWFVEMLPRVLLAKSIGFEGKFIVPSESTFARESLSLIGIEENELVEAPSGAFLIEELFWPTLYDIHDAITLPELYHELRELHVSKLGGNEKASKRLYISRGETTDPGARIVQNEEEIFQELSPLGFEKIRMEKLSLEDQIQLSLHAEMIVGPHGAGNTHCLFMKPHSTLFEFFSPSYINYSLARLASMLGHRYFTLSSEIERNDTADERFIHVPVELFRQMIRNELSG